MQTPPPPLSTFAQPVIHWLLSLAFQREDPVPQEVAAPSLIGLSEEEERDRQEMLKEREARIAKKIERAVGWDLDTFIHVSEWL